MQDVFTVKSVGDPREWRSEKFGGTFLAYPVDLEDEEGKLNIGIDWSRKPESKAPQVGDRIAGHIESSQHGEKFKFDANATKELNGGTSSSGGADYGKKAGSWKPESQYDPEKVARITRAHSQGLAVRLLAHRDDFNEAPKPQRQQAIVAWADFFEHDVEEAALARKLNATRETPAIRPVSADGEIVDEGGIPF